MAAEPPLTCCHQGFQLSHAMIGGTCACPISGSRHGGHSSSHCRTHNRGDNQYVYRVRLRCRWGAWTRCVRLRTLGA